MDLLLLERGKILIILKKSCINRNYSSNKNYVPSMYNISEKMGDNILVFNTVSGALVLFKVNEMGLLVESSFHQEILVKNGFYVPQNENEFLTYSLKLKNSIFKTPNYFTIITTTNCNARCFYCYEADYHRKSIDNNSQKNIVNYLAKKLKDKNNFVLDWYGGEPLLCVDKIDKIISELNEQINLSNYDWSSVITTNATLMDSNLVKHMVSKWNLKVAHITIDGIEQDHNKRKGVLLNGESAFKKTMWSINCLLNAGVYVNLRIHLDNNNKNDFRQILYFIKDFFKYSHFHVFPTFLFPPEYEMPDSYIKDSQKEELFYFIYKIMKEEGVCDYISSFPKAKLEGCYATSKNKIVIAPDGSLHSCVQEFAGDSWEGDEKYLEYKDGLYDCKECKYFPICLGGCIYNRNLVGTVRTPCVRNRFIIRPLLKLMLEDLSV